MTGGDDGGVIEAIELTTRRCRRRALEAVSFQVRPGQVTGLLGLPGSGKSAVLRRMLQLERGGGRTLYDGRSFRSLAYPMRSVGVLLDPLAVHPGRTVAGHLRFALSADPESAPAGRRERIEAVLDVVGLTDQARTRIFELSEGMTVRLGLAQALLGDPQALLLDEPESGLEAEGRPWLAALLRAYAAQGRCVLVTGQSTDAMLGYADRILVLDAGRLVGQRTARQAARELSGDCVIVRTPQVLRLAAILVAAGAEPTQLDGACLEVRGLDRARIGDLAFRNEVPLHELSVRTPGEDPVVAVFEACRKPPAVVPVQTPPAVSVPDAVQAAVRMPFESALDQGLGYDEHHHGRVEVDLVGRQPSAQAQAQAEFEEESALLSVSVVAGRARGDEPPADSDAPTQLIPLVGEVSKSPSKTKSNVKVIEAEVVAAGTDGPSAGGTLVTSSSRLTTTGRSAHTPPAPDAAQAAQAPESAP
jgi:ABC-type multidrug transport system ATPase subunit